MWPRKVLRRMAALCCKMLSEKEQSCDCVAHAALYNQLKPCRAARSGHSIAAVAAATAQRPNIA